VLTTKRLFIRRDLGSSEMALSARSGDCNKSIITLSSKPFTGSFGGLPYDCARIICTDDGEESLALV